MTLEEWLNGGDLHDESKSYSEVTGDFKSSNDCWADDPTKINSPYWYVDVLEDGTAITWFYE